VAALTVVASTALTLAPSTVSAQTGPSLVEIGVWEVPLTLSPTLEGRRDLFIEQLMAAQRRIREFARKHRFQRHTSTSLLQRAEIYDDKPRFDLALVKLRGATRGTKIPRQSCAALEKQTLVLVSPGVYRDLALEGVETDSYEKLMAHELAHGLHARLLDGNDHLVGPTWFYEGFAVYAAGQFELLQEEPTSDEILGVLSGNPEGGLRLYGAVVRHFAKRVPVTDLVKRAYLPTFQSWLLGLDGPEPS
jgi:hypothetical protein